MAMTAIGWYPPKTDKPLITDNSTKDQTVATFKTEMKSLCDSSNFYFDLALAEIEKGSKINEVSTNITPKIKSLEQRLDTRSKAFAVEAQNAGLNEQEFNKVYEDLNKIIQPMTDKLNKLKAKGFEFK